MTNKTLKQKIKKMIDYEMVKDLNLTMENEYDVYKQEKYLGKNYARKWKKGKFDFGKAHKGVKNLIVTPYVRKYQNEYKLKVGNTERDAIAKARLRAIMRSVRDGEY